MAVILVCLCLSASPAPTLTATTQPIDQQCRALLAQWHDRFEQEKLSAIVSPPFVIAGDGGTQRLALYRDRTIRPAAEAMHRKFFDAQPSQPILILLFESEEPYRRLAKAWFKDEDISPYGYFRHDNVMVMNVGTGTGTLVHEMTHALIKPDYPKVPSWFNEGLGSLFEQCTLEGGDIKGLPNWRLAAIQRAIKQDKLRPLAELIGDEHFYAESHVGLNYAQARYLLMYLQERGRLTGYYKQLKANQAEDPTGLAGLKQIIAPDSLDQFEQQWRAWVLTLRFP